MFLTIRRIGYQPEKATLHGGQSRSWSAEQKKSGSAPSPTSSTRCSFGENSISSPLGVALSVVGIRLFILAFFTAPLVVSPLGEACRVVIRHLFCTVVGFSCGLSFQRGQGREGSKNIPSQSIEKSWAGLRLSVLSATYRYAFKSSNVRGRVPLK